MALLSVAEALARVTQGLEPLEVERVALEQARAAACSPRMSRHDLTQPPFDASAMDGYAVRAADVTALPATLRLIGEALCGARLPTARSGPGEAVRIFTGAPVPKGADTVVIQENTEEAPGVRHGQGGGAAPPYPPARPGFHQGRGAASRRHQAWPARADACGRHEPCRASRPPQAEGRDPRHRR